MSYIDDRKLGKLHWPLIICVAAIASLGVWNLQSAGRSLPMQPWIMQARALGLGAIAVGIFLFFDYRILRTLAWPIYLFTLGLLVFVHLKGATHKGATRWLHFGPLTLQPSEFAKISVILMLARFFSDNPVDDRIVRRAGMLVEIRDWFRQQWVTIVSWYRRALVVPPPPMRPTKAARVSGYALSDLWWPAIVLMVPVVIVVKQPDLGTGLVTLAIGGSVILFAGLTNGTLLTLFGGGVSAAVLAWKFALKQYQKDRVEMFLDPEKDAMKKGYHAIQSLIAVGSGKMWGKGWGNGTQNQLSFLPEQHTDFAFPVWAEEHGFVGCVVLIALYMLLVIMALDIAASARDRFGAYLAFGAAALFFWHAFINIGMVIGVLPVVGVPLVLVSYGGSSAVLTMLAIGVLLNVSLRKNQYQ
jgi:rod shape determining protein RodA